MHGTYIGNNKMLVKTVYNGLLTVSSEDKTIMPMLVTRGLFEGPLTNDFLRQLKPGHTVVDIGANIGYFTVLAAMWVGETGKVIGYEASPAVFTVLKDNITMNWLLNQTEIYNKAVYSQNTMIKFHQSDNFQGESSIHMWTESEHDAKQFTTIEVEAVKLDDVLCQYDTIDLLKMDIEGAEYHAFLGMMALMRQGKIKQIAFEWNKPMLGEDADLFMSLLINIQMELKCVYYSLDNEGNTVLLDIETLNHVEFYPFVIVRF